MHRADREPEKSPVGIDRKVSNLKNEIRSNQVCLHCHSNENCPDQHLKQASQSEAQIDGMGVAA